MERLPKVIFFDWHNTLSDSLFWGHLSKSSHSLNKYYADIVTSLFTTHRDKICPWMRGDFSVNEIVGLIATDVGLSADTLYEELQSSCQNMSYVSDEIPDLIQGIKRLGIKAVIATDNMDTFSRFTVPGLMLDQLFDDILNSFDIGFLKSDFDENYRPMFFAKYMSQNNLHYEDVVLLDDSRDRTGNYERLGFHIEEIESSVDLIQCMNRFIT